jgi:AmiR/NasT family two-component response regulator
MDREGTDEESAFKSLLRLSLHHGTTLRARAEAIVRSVGRPEREPEGGAA